LAGLEELPGNPIISHSDLGTLLLENPFRFLRRLLLETWNGNSFG